MTHSFPETLWRRARGQVATVRLGPLSTVASAFGAALLVGALIGACSSDSTADVEPTVTVRPTSPPIVDEVVQQRASVVNLGAVTVPRAGETPADALERIEAIAGRQLDYVRFELAWDQEFPAQEHLAAAADGRSLHVVIDAERSDGTAVRWRDIADVGFGDPLFEEIQGWVVRLADFEGDVLFTFDRLPDTKPERGSAADFKDAWRRMATDLAARAPEIATIWTVSQDALRPGIAAEWYPGEDVVDRIGADLRNSFACDGGDAPWRTPQETLSPLLAFGAQHPGKPLVVAEIATDEDAAEPLRKSAWYAELVELLSTAPFEQVSMVGFFDGEASDQPGCDWRVDSSPVTSEGFGALARASTFGGDDAEPAVVNCSSRLRVPADLSDEALVDTDADGVADVAFGLSNPTIGVGDQGADGHDQRVVLRFPALPTVLAEDEWVELRIRLVSAAQDLDSPLMLDAVADPSSFGLAAFNAAANTVAGELIAVDSPAGYYSAAVTDALAAGLPSVFRLQLTQPPIEDGITAAYLVAMAEAADEADRPTLLVRTC